MWLDQIGQDIVKSFWENAGGLALQYPRDLEKPALLTLPLAIVKLPKLWVSDVKSWLLARGTLFYFSEMNRSLRGCLVASAGKGILFLDATDSADELRFTVAHEIAHFIVDHLQPRNRAIRALGKNILEVIDGSRPATTTERVHSVISSTSLAIYTNLLDRESISTEIWKAEERADRVALALLAPPEEVLAIANSSLPTFDLRKTSMVELLCERYGLPGSIAATYAQSLLEGIGRGPSWSEWLR